MKLLTIALFLNFSIIHILSATTFNQLLQIQTELSSEHCQEQVQTLTSLFKNYIPNKEDIELYSQDTTILLEQFFQARMAIHRKLESLPQRCIQDIKGLYREMRKVEDHIGVLGYKDIQLSPKEIDFNKQATPLIEGNKFRPYFKNMQNVQLLPGDIMITKGVSIISSTISNMSIEPSVFSHIVYVYQDADRALGTIESYIGKGVQLFPLDVALKNENARILVLRAKDRSLAQKAHRYIYERVKKSIEDHQTIHYDYKLDFSDNTSLSCEEIAYDAFNVASLGKFKIPFASSYVYLKDKKFLKSSGLRDGENMLPSDMEVDPRFEVVLDWTDYRLIRDNHRKDALLKAIFSWINKKNYQMNNTFTSSLGKILWSTRQISFLWPLASRLTGIPKDFEPQVPGTGIAFISNLKALESALLPKLEIADRNFFSKHGRYMLEAEMISLLENIRQEDEWMFSHKRKNDFHYFFRSPDLKIKIYRDLI